MALTDSKLRALRPLADAVRRLTDGKGLAIEVRPSGARLWRYRYRFNGKASMLSLGEYPGVSLADARRLRDEARKQLAAGINPAEQRREAKAEAAAVAAAVVDTFEAVARAWMARQDVVQVTANKNRWLLEDYLFPEIGSLPIASITPRILLDALRKIEDGGRLETASRAKIKAGQVFRYAILEGKAESDPTASLRGALKAAAVKHHAAITDPAKIGELLRAMDGFNGEYTTLCALRFAPLVFVRPGELRKAEWVEFDLDGSVWRIPGARMKMKAAHIVPLSTQAVTVLRDLHHLTGTGRYVFPSILTAARPMSENTVNGALRRLGYTKDEMTGHGFRSMASTRLNEMGWNPDAIERQLAHAESNKVRGAYNSAAQYLPERKRMMQAWADYLDGLRHGADVVAIMRDARRR
ncbi:MAG: tyrosine-type recombinase/integrase [Xanthomonadales bacterium]|nr:tyrosine-type recombinase/integrase [Xanthomonadales bacterium]